jgi:hypothetical protein
MAFTTSNMQIFSQRVQRWMLAAQNLRDEAVRLNAIYVNETASGTDPQWADTDIALAAEHVDAINCFADFKKFWENEALSTVDRQVWITPFIQVD